MSKRMAMAIADEPTLMLKKSLKESRRDCFCHSSLSEPGNLQPSLRQLSDLSQNSHRLRSVPGKSGIRPRPIGGLE